ITMNVLGVDGGTTKYTVAFRDLPPGDKIDFIPERVRILRRVGGTLLKKEVDVTLNDHNGIECEMETSVPEGRGVARIYAVGNPANPKGGMRYRVYELV